MAQTGWRPRQIEAFLRMQLNAQSQHYRQAFPKASHHVILVDGQAAGRLIVNRTHSEIHLVDISLLPDFRRRGVGTRLLQSLRAEAEESHRPVRLHVILGNPALHLYQRLGFEITEDTGATMQMQWSPARSSAVPEPHIRVEKTRQSERRPQWQNHS